MIFGAILTVNPNAFDKKTEQADSIYIPANGDILNEGTK